MSTTRLLCALPSLKQAGFLAMWRAYTTKEKAILIELAWMSIFKVRLDSGELNLD